MLLEMSSLGKLLQLLGRRVDQLHGTLRRAIPNLIRSDAAEGTEFVYPAVDAAEREEHSSFDHSIGTDRGLTKAAANEISEGLYLRRYSVRFPKFVRKHFYLQARLSYTAQRTYN